MARKLDLADIGRFLLFLRKYDVVMQSPSIQQFRQHEGVLLVLRLLFPGRQDDNAVLRDFKQFYDGANLSIGNNFLSTSMKANQTQSIIQLKELITECFSAAIYTPLDDFIQWNEQHDNDTFTQTVNEIIENAGITEDERPVLEANRGIFLHAGQVSAAMSPEILRSTQALHRIFQRYRRGRYAPVAEIESTDESSEDGN